MDIREATIRDARISLNEIATVAGGRSGFSKIRPETRAALAKLHDGAHSVLRSIERS